MIMGARAARGRVGAACAVYVDGRQVVDLWAGLADPVTGRAWERDTLALVFSVTKGLMAILAHRIAESGRLDLDAPVADYWPEFDQAGKADVTVRALLSHRAGLMAVDRDLTLEQALAWTPVIEALQEQAPLWPPGSAWEYHSLTYGWLVGEVLRRVTGQRPGPLWRSEVAEPLGLDVWIGLPDEHAPRVALKSPAAAPAVPPDDPDGIHLRSITLGSAFVGDSSIAAGLNDRRVYAGEVPGAAGIGTARSLAKAYAATVTEVDGVRVLRPDTARRAAEVQSEGPRWRGFGTDHPRFGSGFIISFPERPLLGPSSFGHDGAGGELAFADLDSKVGLGYINNQLGGAGDPRANRLVESLRTCLTSS